MSRVPFVARRAGPLVALGIGATPLWRRRRRRRRPAGPGLRAEGPAPAAPAPAPPTPAAGAAHVRPRDAAGGDRQARQARLQDPRRGLGDPPPGPCRRRRAAARRGRRDATRTATFASARSCCFPASTTRRPHRCSSTRSATRTTACAKSRTPTSRTTPSPPSCRGCSRRSNASRPSSCVRRWFAPSPRTARTRRSRRC